MEVTVIIGVRPHYVKASALNALLGKTSIIARFLDIHQHFDQQLRDNILSEDNLQIICTSNPNMHSENPIDEMSRQMRDVYNWFSSNEGKRSKAVIVFGDANPAFVASIVANRMNIPIIHIEAGVRRVPTEKEHWNSLITDQLSTLRYCYTSNNMSNLVHEGLSEGTYLVGDLFARWTIEKAQGIVSPIINEPYVLVSIHRPQNCSAICFSNICACLSSIKKMVIWILHPRTSSLVEIIKRNSNFQTIPSQPHSRALCLIKYADFILTDSGGFVREGVLLGKKVIVCHEQGMWVDLVNSGAILRTDNDIDSITKAVGYTISHSFPSGKEYFIVPKGEMLFLDTITHFLDSIPTDNR